MLRKLLLALLFFSFAKISFGNLIDAVSSPDGNIFLRVVATGANATGYKLAYEVEYKKNGVIKTSQLGFVLKEPSIRLDYFAVTGKEQSSADNTWQPVWGEVKAIRNNYNQLVLKLKGQNRNIS